MAFLLSGGSVFVCGLSLPVLVALERWLWGGSFLLAWALLAPRGGCGRFLPLCRRCRPWFLSFGLVVRLAPVSFGFVAVRRGLAFPFLLAWSAAAKRAVPSSLGWVCTPSWRGGLRGGGGGRGALAVAGVSFFGWVAFLRGAWVPLGFRFPLAVLAGWRFFLLGRRARAWFLSFGLVGVAALGGRKARCRARRRPRYAVELLGVVCGVFFLAVWGGACWVLGSFFGLWVLAAIGCVGVLCGRVPRRAVWLCRHRKSGRARLLPAIGGAWLGKKSIGRTIKAQKARYSRSINP